MKTLVRSLLAALLLVLTTGLTQSQDSDYEVKQNFERRIADIKQALDRARTVAEIDSLGTEIARLEQDFVRHRDLLDKALYPLNYTETMSDVRDRHLITYDRVYLIQTQGIRLGELEAQIASLTARLDTLTAERNRLYAELKEARKSQGQMRDLIRRLYANLEAKDRLLFALVDSIFLPYGGDVAQTGEVQKEALGRKLAQANVVDHVYDVAADNVRFLNMTQLQPKDYGRLIEHERQFANRWSGLREKMIAVAAAPSMGGSGAGEAGKPRTGKGATAPAPPPPGAAVDSMMARWQQKLYGAFWDAIAAEYTTKAVIVQPFSSPQSFSQSIRAQVATLKTTGEDPEPFVAVWKERIDKEWRDALTRDGVLGKTEYAELDKLVSELHKETINLQFLFYILLALAAVVAGWWFFIRKPKNPPPQEAK